MCYLPVMVRERKERSKELSRLGQVQAEQHVHTKAEEGALMDPAHTHACG